MMLRRFRCGEGVVFLRTHYTRFVDFMENPQKEEYEILAGARKVIATQEASLFDEELAFLKKKARSCISQSFGQYF